MTEAAGGFLLDLSYPFAGEVELVADLFERHGLLAVQPEIERHHIGLALRQGRQGPAHLPAEGIGHEGSIRVLGMLIFQYIQQAILLPLHKWCIDGYMPTGEAHVVGDFLGNRLLY